MATSSSSDAVSIDSPSPKPISTKKISKLLLTPSPSRKRGRDCDKVELDECNENEAHSNPKKKPRRSTRVRFQPLKFWANESIITDPNKPLTMKDIEEKGDSLYSSSKDQLLSSKRHRRKRKKSKSKSKKKETKIKEENNMFDNIEDIDNEYKCDEWKEYLNDKYYSSDNFDGNAWIKKLDIDDNDDKDHDELIQKCIIFIPTKVRMNKTGDIYGGSMISEPKWKSGFIEIPPNCVLNEDLAEEMALFFVHFAEKRKLKFTLFTKCKHNQYDDQIKTFYLSEGSQFYVPKGHYYKLTNLSTTKKVQLTVTQFIHKHHE